MKTYTLNDAESKTLLEMAIDCIERGMISENYEVDKINDIINDSLNLYGKHGRVEVYIKVEVR